MSRTSFRAPPAVHRLSPLVLVVALWGPAHALAGARHAAPHEAGESGFLIRTGTLLPSNAVGLPWSGRVPWLGDRFVPPSRARFRVQRREGREWRAIPFDLRLIRNRWITSFLPPRGIPLVLVAPRGGLRPGARYRFVAIRGRDRLIPFDLGEVVDSQVVEVRVARAALTVTAPRAEVRVGRASLGEVVTSSKRGGGTARFLGVRVPIQLVLPAEHRRWQGALLHAVRVDGVAIWRPDRSRRRFTPPGRSAAGWGRELLYAWCDWWREGVPASGIPGSRLDRATVRPDFVLPGGPHEVEFRAWLPGTDLHFQGTAAVVLSCREAAAGR